MLQKYAKNIILNVVKDHGAVGVLIIVKMSRQVHPNGAPGKTLLGHNLLNMPAGVSATKVSIAFVFAGAM